MLICNEHKSASYAPRTYHNASQGVTLAVAVDFSTAGEKLTHKAANGKIVQIDWGTDYVIAARALYSMLKKHDCHVVNIAGNGIYTLSKKGCTQTDANTYVYKILKLVHEHWPIEFILSGGQTGMDVAGLIAGVALGIESVGTWPKGYKMRFEDGKDVDKTEEWVHNYIITQVAELEV